VNLTPGWAQVYVQVEKGRGKEMVIEVKRMRSLEDTVRRIGEGLEGISTGFVAWGGRA
jgi:hypothetical protein